MLGRTIGSYTILDRIGAGGMGEVYLAQHRRIDRRVAIKFLLPGLSKDAELVNRFFNEARATSVIKHPGIVEVFDCDVLDDRAYIVMEYLEGENLALVIERTGGFRAEPLAVGAVIGRLASALAAAHAKGIVHRDLKPENIFLAIDRSGDAPLGVKILDFGIAKLADSHFGSSKTRTGSLLGTPSYMAPEQCRGLPNVDHRVDVYSLGCILFEMLTGRRVFELENPGDLLVAHISLPPPQLSAVIPEVPPQIDALVSGMLAKNPDERPQRMEAVVSVFEALLGAPASEFTRKIPVQSGLMPLPPSPRTRPMPAVSPSMIESGPIPVGSGPIPVGSGPIPVASGPAAAGSSPVAVTATPGSVSPTTPLPRRPGMPTPVTANARRPTPAAGGTQLLPVELGSGRIAAPSPNDSTFRQSASEVIAQSTLPRSKRTLFVVGGVAVAAVLGGVVLLSRPDHKTGAAGEAAPSADPIRVPATAPPPPPPPPAEIVHPPVAPPTPPPAAPTHVAAKPPVEPDARHAHGAAHELDKTHDVDKHDADKKDHHASTKRPVKPETADVAKPAKPTEAKPAKPGGYFGVGD
jgi:serine/threonine-protein kinase